MSYTYTGEKLLQSPVAVTHILLKTIFSLPVHWSVHVPKRVRSELQRTTQPGQAFAERVWRSSPARVSAVFEGVQAQSTPDQTRIVML